MKRGLFLTFEGIDGAGKTTQIGLLRDKLAHRGIASLFVREPGSTLVGEKIRQILLTPENKGMAAATEILLYAAARAQIVTEKIRPALDEGKMVVCDRYIHSSLAYQG
ncbi:MAG: dTMP kinase, partial [Firmicutes bacterium]|nr:dTMP kinase [Bacillota bacterium]